MRMYPHVCNDNNANTDHIGTALGKLVRRACSLEGGLSLKKAVCQISISSNSFANIQYT